MKTFWLKFEMEEDTNCRPDLMDLTDDFPGVVDGVRVESITLFDDEQARREVGSWIPCDADNPPPAAGPLLVWVQAYPDFPRGGLYSESGPRWVETWVGGGKLGHDVTHYMLIEEPK